VCLWIAYRRQEIICRHAEQAATGRWRQTAVSLVRQHRRVYDTARSERKQQRSVCDYSNSFQRPFFLVAKYETSLFDYKCLRCCRGTARRFVSVENLIKLVHVYRSSSFIVGPKFTLAASHAAPSESRAACAERSINDMWKRRTDGRTDAGPLHYAFW